MRKSLFFLSSLATVLLLSGAGCLSFGAVKSGPLGMYRSGDKGDTWQQIAALPTAKGVQSIAGANIYRVYADPSDPNALYLGTRGQGLFYSYDNGDSWRSVAAMSGKFIYGLVVDPKDKCVIYVSDGPHIYKTEDCLRTWTLVYAEERPTERFVALAVDYGDSALVYAAQWGGDILVSKDSGKSWKVVKRFGFGLRYLVADSSQPKRLYVASHRDGLYRSDDSGESWVDNNTSLASFSGSKTFYRLVLNPAAKDKIFWVSKYGILRSDDGGASWSAMKLIPPPGSVDIYGFAVSPKNSKEMYFTATILGDQSKHVRSTFYKTVDGGVSWVTKKLPTNTIPVSITVHPDNNNALLVGFASLEKQPDTTF